MRYSIGTLGLLALGCAAAQVGCGGNDLVGPSPGTGSIRVITETAGPASDPNGFTVVVDDSWLQSIGANATLTRQVTAGGHSVKLVEVSSNCALQGANPRSVLVQQDEVAEVRFTLQCTSPTGRIAVRVATDRPERAPEGHTVVLDGRDSVHVAPADSIEFTSLADGVHTVELVNPDPYCLAGLGQPRDVTVRGSAALVDFSVACRTPPAGELLFDSGGDIWRGDLAGLAATRVGPGHGGRWSPDGRRIAFSQGDFSSARVYVLTLGEAAPRAVAEGMDPDWSPDGTKLVYVNEGRLRTVNVDGSGSELLGEITGASTPAWAPDGRRIAFTHTDSCSSSILGRYCKYSVQTVDSDGTRLVTVTTSRGGQNPAWSPDGRRIAYVQPAILFVSGPHVVLLDIGTRSEEALMVNTPAVSSPVWSPDGAYLAVNAQFPDGPSDIVIVGTARGSIPVRLHRPDGYPTAWH